MSQVLLLIVAHFLTATLIQLAVGRALRPSGMRLPVREGVLYFSGSLVVSVLTSNVSLYLFGERPLVGAVYLLALYGWYRAGVWSLSRPSLEDRQHLRAAWIFVGRLPNDSEGGEP